MADGRASCADLEAAGFNQENVANDVWRLLLHSGAFIERPDDDPFEFASGELATLKVDAEVLEHRTEARERIMGYVAAYPCIAEADVLLYVPEGMQKFTTDLGAKLDIPVAHMQRDPKEGALRYDFVFSSPEDRELGLGASQPRILEDVVTTLGSVASVASHLNPDQQDIHSLAFLLRGQVNPEHRARLAADHYLAKRSVPTSRSEFTAGLTDEEMTVYIGAHHQRMLDDLPE